MAPKLRPGTPAPESGQYKVLDENNRSVGREVTAIKNKPLPPTPEPGGSYKLTDRTKHIRK